ncbi:MAG: branched-chain-amino-acid transaminase [Planctomycetota bacterium]|nr:branched-chain-amino-acid transaminase [Planctomycetota bacterium]
MAKKTGKAPKIWLNGELVARKDAKISVFDHGLLYGDGVFEGIRSYGGKVFRLEKHIRRLFDSARGIRLEIRMAPERLANAVVRTLRASGRKNAYIRVVVTRGVGTLGLNPNRCRKPSIFIIVDRIQLYAKKVYDNGMAIITAATMRNHPNAVNPRLKSLNYLNNILAKVEAIDAETDEAVMLNHLGYVAECTGDNIFIVRDQRLLTPPIAAGILEGITRDEIIDIARNAGIEVREENLTRQDLYTADECFLTGTAAEVVPVVEIDKRTIGEGKPGLVTKRLAEEFHRRTRI